MPKVKFDFELDEEMVEVLEAAEGMPVEEALSKKLAEVVFCKTHLEVKQVLRGKSEKLPLTAENIAKAQKARAILHADQMEVSPKELGLLAKDVKREAELAAQVRNRPAEPKLPKPAPLPEPEEIPEEHFKSRIFLLNEYLAFPNITIVRFTCPQGDLDFCVPILTLECPC